MSRQFVMLKADDLGYPRERRDIASLARIAVKRIIGKPVEPRLRERRWKHFLDYVERMKIKASLGLIAKHLEDGGSEFLALVRMLAANKAFEIWNHGYDHLRIGTTKDGQPICEFRGTTLEYQLEHIVKAQFLAKHHLGTVMRSFGAPENATDGATIIALDRIEEIKVWYFGPAGSTKMIIDRVAEIERPLFRPSFGKFVENYDETLPMLALQVHPANWESVDFDEFDRITEFLLARPVHFINPLEYSELR